MGRGSACTGQHRPSPAGSAGSRPPEAADTQSSTSRDMPRDASYRRSFTLPAGRQDERRAGAEDALDVQRKGSVASAPALT